jgi:hypothetical protein
MQTLNRYIANHLVFGNILCILSGVIIADPSRTTDLGRTETILVAIEGMKRHGHSTKVHRNCLTLLRLLTTENTESHSVVLEHSDAIHCAMKSYPDDAGIQAEACVVLANVCSTATAKDQLSASGCIETVVQCQLRHRDNVRVQHAALFFYSSLLLEDDARNGSVFAFGGGAHILDFVVTGPGVQQGQQEAGRSERESESEGANH